MRQKGIGPIRTCIGCRHKREKEEMIWFAYSREGVVRVNAKKPHQGRGFYLCPDLQCFHMATGRKKRAPLLGAKEIQSVLLENISKSDQVCNREEGNGKE